MTTSSSSSSSSRKSGAGAGAGAAGASSSSSSSKKSSASTEPTLPSHLEEMRTRVFMKSSAPDHVHTIMDADAYAAYGVRNNLTLDDFKQSLSINVLEKSKDRIVFEMIGVDAPIANALRRILLAEVPTMAIEKVIIFQNTSIIQDEVLAHRLGLIPIAVDPREFSFVSEHDGVPNELNTLVFTLDVKCTRVPHVPDTATNEEKYMHSLVYSRDLVWQPQGRQAEKFGSPDTTTPSNNSSNSNSSTSTSSSSSASSSSSLSATKKRGGIRPYYEDIVIAKMRPGQSIEAELHVEKGIGQMHAKWSPVATASYRLMPEIRLTRDVVGAEADALVRKCPMNVFDIEEVGGSSKQRRATVARPRNCTMCRECIRPDHSTSPTIDAAAAAEAAASAGAASAVQLRRVRDHFIFSVETTGAYSPVDVVREAIRVLRSKSVVLRDAALSSEQRGNNHDGGDEEEEEEDQDMDELS